MKRFLPIKVFPGIVFSILAVLALFSGTKLVDAQVPKPRIPCGTEADPEFHSLRPYQASPCTDSVKALYCSNDLIFIESFNVAGEGDCKKRGVDGDFTCNPDFLVDGHDLYVNLADSMFPIMGNTEQVTNSQGGTEEFDDATKLNEYASWYLSGVNNKAEYGATKNTNDEVINFSGPIQKLMPGAILDMQRIATIISVTEEAPTDTEDELNPTSGQEPQNHNQIVVCESGGKPVECPNGKPLRLKDWDDGMLSIFNVIPNWFGAEKWNKKVPPLPWQFEKEIYYQKAYNEWRGKACEIVPIINKLFCIESLFVPNKWSDLFAFVPTSNTVDKKGVEWIMGVQFHPSGETQISGETYGQTLNAPLYFAHTQEVKELSEFLNKSYMPKGVESVPLPNTTEKNVCSAVTVRSNQGDDLFPGLPRKGIEVHDVTYTITQSICHERIEWVECFKGDRQKLCKRHTLTCPAEVIIKIKTGTKTPWANEIFSTTVADSGSTFRKIYPKVESGAPVTCVADIPTVTKVTYDGLIDSEVPNGGDLDFKVENFPSDGAASPDAPELTFPHIGSVYEYFLKGIQTALRPKGYGEEMPVSGEYCANTLEGGDCSWNMQKINKGIRAAASKYNVPASLLDAIFQIESYEWIHGTETYQCVPNSAGALGVAQITQETYDDVTCDSEKMEDERMCDSYDPKLSRCNFEDAFELMARVLLYKAGKWNSVSCTATGGISESDVQTWYKAACNYYGTSSPDSLTIGLANDIPAAERRQNGDMNYCDIVGYKMGAFPPYP